VISENAKKELNAAAIEVFGTMYFTPVELLPDLPPRDSWHHEDQYIMTLIGYSGPLRAKLCFYFPRTLAMSIAGGFLGIDEDAISDQQLIDTMRESANMIVGNFLGRLDPQGACTLGIPEASVVQGFSPDAVTASGDLLAFVSDFGLLWMVYNA
jgi:CheY-specific phosphatase CheX